MDIARGSSPRTSAVVRVCECEPKAPFAEHVSRDGGC